MLFLDYEEYKNRYIASQKQYDEILQEKEELFAKTQPSAVRFDKERVTGGAIENAFDEYLVKKERKQIDDRLAEARNLLSDRKRLLALKREELYASNDILDKVYRMNHIEHIRAYKIARIINYSVSQVYRYLEQIDRLIEKMR